MLKRLSILLASAAVLVGSTAWAGVFVANDDGTITDSATGVEWAGDASTPGVNTCKGGSLNWAQAQVYVDCLNDADYLGNNDWRLPTTDDFAALLGNQGLATGLQGKLYWSGTELGNDGRAAYAFNLNTGAASRTVKTRHLAVWPVRDAASVLEVQSPAVAGASPSATDVAKYNVTVNQGANGKITPVGLTGVKAGVKKTFTVKPNKGFIIKSVTVNGVSQDLNGKDLAKPFKVVLIVTSETTIGATFDDAPVTKGFPTYLIPGSYKLNVNYCANNYCTTNYDSATVTYDVNNPAAFFDFYESLFDYYIKQLASLGDCAHKASCTKFNGSSFGCKLSATCKTGYGFSMTHKFDILSTLQQ